ncbi:MAG: AAA family ATPase [Bacteroidaceae bacterium]|nr:AAA family ATPase [Bacteroidaceae bacterium]
METDVLNSNLDEKNNEKKQLSNNLPELNDGVPIAAVIGYEEQSFIPIYTDKQREEMKLRLEAYLQEEGIDVENPIDPPEFLIEVNGVPALPIGDLSLITGMKKTGKSTTYQVLAAVLLGEEGRWGPIVRTLKDPRIVIFDSEQARYHAQKANMRILRMAGLPQKNIYDRLRYVPLRMLSYEGRQQVIADYLETYRPNVVIIDGIVDMITDFNSIEESKPFVDKLMAWATHYQCCVIGLIHTSKTVPDEPRGHLGAFGVEKAYMTIETKKGQLSIFTVGTHSCRGEEMPEWHFKYDGEDIVLADEDAKLYRKETNNKISNAMKEKADEAYQKNAAKVLDLLKGNNGSMMKSHLVKLIQETKGLGQQKTAAYNLLKKMAMDKKISDNANCITIASE